MPGVPGLVQVCAGCEGGGGPLAALLGLSMGAPVGYLDPYLQVFFWKNSYLDL